MQTKKDFFVAKPVLFKRREELPGMTWWVIFYTDVMTKSLQAAWDVCQYRKEKQLAYNQLHGITPKSVSRPVQESLRPVSKEEDENLVSAEELPAGSKKIDQTIGKRNV